MSEWPMGSSFDDIFERFFGSMGAQPPVQRVDLCRLLTDDAKRLLAEASQEAQDAGNPEVTPEHVLHAAAVNEPGRTMLANLGIEPDAAAAEMSNVTAQYPTDRKSVV